ncbi:EndoU domain-containing protein [Streptomyces sp. NPDC002540]
MTATEYLINARGHRLQALQPDQVTGPALPGPRLRVDVRFVDSPADADLVVTLRTGEPDEDPEHRMVENVWYTGVHPAAYVHEIFHVLGVIDDNPDERTLLTPGGRGEQHLTDGQSSLMGPFTNPYEQDFVLTTDHLKQIADILTPYLHHTIPDTGHTPRITPTEPDNADTAPAVEYQPTRTAQTARTSQTAKVARAQLQELVTALGSQANVAIRLKVHPSSVSAWCNGARMNPKSIETIVKLHSELADLRRPQRETAKHDRDQPVPTAAGASASTAMEGVPMEEDAPTQAPAPTGTRQNGAAPTNQPGAPDTPYTPESTFTPDEADFLAKFFGRDQVPRDATTQAPAPTDTRRGHEESLDPSDPNVASLLAQVAQHDTAETSALADAILAADDGMDVDGMGGDVAPAVDYTMAGSEEFDLRSYLESREGEQVRRFSGLSPEHVFREGLHPEGQDSARPAQLSPSAPSTSSAQAPVGSGGAAGTADASGGSATEEQDSPRGVTGDAAENQTADADALADGTTVGPGGMSGEAQHATDDTVDPASAGVDPSAARRPAGEARDDRPLDADADPAVWDRLRGHLRGIWDAITRLPARFGAWAGRVWQSVVDLLSRNTEVPFPGAVETGRARIRPAAAADPSDLSSLSDLLDPSDHPSRPESDLSESSDSSEYFDPSDHPSRPESDLSESSDSSEYFDASDHSSRPESDPAESSNSSEYFDASDHSSRPESDPAESSNSSEYFDAPDHPSRPASDLSEFSDPEPENATEEQSGAGDITGRPEPAGHDAAPRERTPGPSRIETQLDTHRPPHVDSTMPAPSTEDAPVVFTDGSRLPEYLTSGYGEGDDRARSYGHSRVALRGTHLVVAEIAERLGGPNAEPGLDEALDDLSRALDTTPHLFTGDGYESPPFGGPTVRTLRVVTRPYGNWERFTDVHATPVKIDAAHRSQVGDGRTGGGSNKTKVGAGVTVGPTSGVAGFGRVNFSTGTAKAHEHALQDQTSSQVESRAAEGSHLHLDDVRYEVTVIEAGTPLPAERGTAFSVRNGLTVRLPDSATSPTEPGPVPQRMTLDERADYRLVHTEGYGPVMPLRDKLVKAVDAQPGTRAHEDLSAFFNAEYFQRAADLLAGGSVPTEVLFDEKGAPLGAFVVERVVPREAELLSETKLVEMRHAVQQTARNERTVSRSSSLGAEITVGPSAKLGIFGTARAGGVLGREHTVTDSSAFGGSGAQKIVGRAKGVPTVLYHVRKTVYVRRSGSAELIQVETWTLDRMTHTEARRLAGWDDGTALRARHENAPLPPAYLTDDRPAVLGMSRPEEFRWEDGETPADASKGWLQTFTDQVVRAAAQQYPGVLAPLEEFTDPKDDRWRGQEHFVMALRNTLRVLSYLSHHSVAGNLGVITTTGLTIPLDVPRATWTRSRLTLRISGELTGRRYEGTQNDLLLRTSAPGTERLDGSSTVKNTTSWGLEARGGVTSNAVVSARAMWARSQGHGTQYGASVFFEPLASSARPSHLHSYRLTLSAGIEGFARYRSVPRALSLGALGALPQESRDLTVGQEGATDETRTAFAGRVVLAVPDEHSLSALDSVPEDRAVDEHTPVSHGPDSVGESRPTSTRPAPDTEPAQDAGAAPTWLSPVRARALLDGAPADAEGAADGAREWDVFGGHAHQTVSVGSALALAKAAQDLMAELSGSAWHFTRTGAVPHDAMARLFQSHALAGGFDQASGPAGTRSVFFAEGLLRHRVGELVHQVQVQRLRVVSEPAKLGNELAIGHDLHIAGSATAGSGFTAAMTAGGRYTTYPGGTELVSTQGLRYGLGSSRTETTSVVRTVTWDANADDGSHKVLVAGDTRHDIAASVRIEGLLSPVLSPFHRGGPAGVRLTLPDSYLGHLGEKTAHRLGLLRDGAGTVPSYTSHEWTTTTWWHEHPFGSYPVNSLDATQVLADFDRQLRAWRVDDADRERVRSLVTPRALRALREQMTTGGITGRTRVGRWIMGMRLGSRMGALRVELVAEESRFDGLDHGVTIEDTRTATVTEARGGSTGSSRSYGIGVNETVVTSSTPAPPPGELLSVPTTFDGSVGTSEQTSRSLSRTRTRTQRFYAREPHAQYRTAYRLRLTLDTGQGTRIVQDSSVGTLREYVPLSLTAPAQPSVPADDPLGPPTVPELPPTVVRLSWKTATEADVDAWRSTRLPDGTQGPFEPPAVGWMVRRVVGLDTLRTAATLALAEAYGTQVAPGGDGTGELTGAALDTALERASRTGLTRPETASALALDHATRDAALAAFFAESGTPTGYPVPGLNEEGSAHGDFRLYSRPDLTQATLLAVVPESTMEVAERDAAATSGARSRTSGYDSALGAGAVVAADTVGSVMPAGNLAGPNVSTAARWTRSAADGAQLTEKPAGRSYVFAVPADWLGVAEVERSRHLFGRVRRVRAVEARTQLITVVHEDTARELGLIDEGNFPSRVADAWNQVTKASKAWIAADEAYWKKRRTLVGQPENTPGQGDGDPVDVAKQQLLQPLLDEAEAAAAEFHRVRAAADRLTRWHQLPAEPERAGEPERRQGLTEPPPVVYQAPRPAADGSGEPAARFTSPNGIPNQLVSPEGVSYTVGDAYADGDGFFHALAEGVYHASPEKLRSWAKAARRQKIVRALPSRLAKKLADPRTGDDLWPFTSPDTKDRFNDLELSESKVEFAEDSPELREFKASGRIPLHAELSAELSAEQRAKQSAKQRAALARAQLLRSGDTAKDAGWDHGAADLLPKLAARHFGARITVVSADGAFQDFTPEALVSEAEQEAQAPKAEQEALPRIVLQLKDRSYRLARPAGVKALPAPSPAAPTAAEAGGTPAGRPPRPAHDSVPWTAGPGAWRPAFAPGRAPSLTGPGGTVHTLVQPRGDGNGFWSALADGVPEITGGERTLLQAGAASNVLRADPETLAGKTPWDDATEKEAAQYAAGVLDADITVVAEDGTVRARVADNGPDGRSVVLYRRGGEYLLARPERGAADAPPAGPRGGAEDTGNAQNQPASVRDTPDLDTENTAPGSPDDSDGAESRPDTTATPPNTPDSGSGAAGAVVTSEAAERQYGMPAKNFDKFRRFAAERGLVIDVRPTNTAAPAWLARGALPKPKEIKAKTINELDVRLGAGPEDIGLVGYFQPKEPERSPGLDDETWGRLRERYDQRLREFQDLAPAMDRLEAEGSFTVRDGVVHGRDDTGAERPITGDHDIFDLSTPGGSRLTTPSYDRVVGEMQANDMGVMHGAHTYWPSPRSPYSEKVFTKILGSHVPGGEPLLRFRPGDINGRLVWWDPAVSLAGPHRASEAGQHERLPDDVSPAADGSAGQPPTLRSGAAQSRVEPERAEDGSTEPSDAEQNRAEQDVAAELRALLGSPELLATPVRQSDVEGRAYSPKAAAFGDWHTTRVGDEMRLIGPDGTAHTLHEPQEDGNGFWPAVAAWRELADVTEHVPLTGPSLPEGGLLDRVGPVTDEELALAGLSQQTVRSAALQRADGGLPQDPELTEPVHGWNEATERMAVERVAASYGVSVTVVSEDGTSSSTRAPGDGSLRPELVLYRRQSEYLLAEPVVDDGPEEHRPAERQPLPRAQRSGSTHPRVPSPVAQSVTGAVDEGVSRGEARHTAPPATAPSSNTSRVSAVNSEAPLEGTFAGAVEIARGEVERDFRRQWVGAWGGALEIRRFQVRRYRLSTGDFGTRVVVRIRLQPVRRKSITDEQLRGVMERAQMGVDKYYNQGSRLPNGDLLRVDLEFVQDREAALPHHHVVKLHAKIEREDQENWSLTTKAGVLAHEVGHLVGLEDEYRDGADFGRRAVYQDEALMVGPATVDPRGRGANLDMDHPADDRRLGRNWLPPRHLRQLGAPIEAALGTARLRVDGNVVFSTAADRLEPGALPTRAHFSEETRRAVLYGEPRTGGGGHLPPAGMSARPRPVALEGTANPNGTYRAEYPGLPARPGLADRSHPLAGDLHVRRRGQMMFPDHWTEDDAVYAAEQAYLDALRSGRVVPVPGRDGVFTWTGVYAGVRIEGELKHGGPLRTGLDGARGASFTGFRPSDNQTDQYGHHPEGVSPKPLVAPAYAPLPAKPTKPQSGPAFGQRVEDMTRYGNRRTLSGVYHAPRRDLRGYHGLKIMPGATHENGTYQANVWFLDPNLHPRDWQARSRTRWRLHRDGTDHRMFPDQWSPSELLDAVEEAHGAAIGAGTSKLLQDGRTYWVGEARGVRMEGLVRDGQHVAYRPASVQPDLHLRWPRQEAAIGSTVPAPGSFTRRERPFRFDVQRVLFANGQWGLDLTVRIHMADTPSADDRVNDIWTSMREAADAYAGVTPAFRAPLVRVSLARAENPQAAHYLLEVEPVPWEDETLWVSLVRAENPEETHSGFFLPVGSPDASREVPGILGVRPMADDLAELPRLLGVEKPAAGAWQPPPGIDPEQGQADIKRALERDVEHLLSRPTTLREPDPAASGAWGKSSAGGLAGYLRGFWERITALGAWAGRLWGAVVDWLGRWVPARGSGVGELGGDSAGVGQPGAGAGLQVGGASGLDRMATPESADAPGPAGHASPAMTEGTAAGEAAEADTAPVIEIGAARDEFDRGDTVKSSGDGADRWRDVPDGTVPSANLSDVSQQSPADGVSAGRGGRAELDQLLDWQEVLEIQVRSGHVEGLGLSYSPSAATTWALADTPLPLRALALSLADREKLMQKLMEKYPELLPAGVRKGVMRLIPPDPA